ncbi:hypothetical protein CHS0354_012718 [Potamilus streckersoni]|uniref:Uncharacterized protein n=1 Tax=Potamilus streckersoni TaxID=2493646 RepID=A0AAE0SXK8_9BIVA|nr:hypothetical protein CHS0354_012718 [Potamilus streckersoni]
MSATENRSGIDSAVIEFSAHGEPISTLPDIDTVSSHLQKEIIAERDDKMHALTKGSPAFYEHRKEFARKSAVYCSSMNIKIDWSRFDPMLQMYVLYSYKVVPCHHFRSFAHDSDFCNLAARQQFANQDKFHQ